MKPFIPFDVSRDFFSLVCYYFGRVSTFAYICIGMMIEIRFNIQRWGYGIVIDC